MANLTPIIERKKIPATLFLAGIVLAGTGGSPHAQPSEAGYIPPGLRFVATPRSITARAQLQQIAASLKTTNSGIARALDVSRQTIYNWLRGDPPSAILQNKLDQLQRAGQLLLGSDLMVKASLLNPMMKGMNFWQLVQRGEDAEKLAKKLIDDNISKDAQRKLIAERIATKRARGAITLFETDDIS
jgi:DNA-binding XRE family transcriptional regulator